MYEVRNQHGVTMHVNGKRTWQFLSHAKDFAEACCKANNRTIHYTVVKIQDVWTTSTLDKAIGG